MTLGTHILTLTGTDVGNVIQVNGVDLTMIVKSIHVLGTGATVAGDQYRIEDPDGNLLYRSQANGAWYESESITQRQWSNGLKLITLDSGAIDIEFEFSGSPRGESRY